MIYVHIPYCRSFCTYCDFYSEVAAKCSTYGGFAQALAAEIAAREGEIRNNILSPSGVNTLYIGGGTPSVLPLSVFDSILSSLESVGCTLNFDEFTVEVNPEDIVEKGHSYVEGLLKLGVNRVSMGVQSFDDATLKWMNRRHDSSRAKHAYAILEESGVKNISIDLIFGLPQLDLAGWEDNLSKAMSISPSGQLPNHISSYQLSVEEGSALASMMAKGNWAEATDEVCVQQYEALCKTLRQAGYHHYEISNFALPGYEARHNSAYWDHVPYVGLGPGAHSFGSVVEPLSFESVLVRRWNNPDLAAYIEAGKSGDFSSVQGGEDLTLDQLNLERLMLGLRTSSGLPMSFMEETCSCESIRQALDKGHLQVLENSRFRIPEDKFFISDAIITDLSM